MGAGGVSCDGSGGAGRGLLRPDLTELVVLSLRIVAYRGERSGEVLKGGSDGAIAARVGRILSAGETQ